MIFSLLLAAATVPQTAIDAERAFAADAQKNGQWTAFRHWASDRATMFVPASVMLAKAKSTSPETTAAVDGAPPLNGICTMWVPVRVSNSSTE